jgi:hypothetical protein
MEKRFMGALRVGGGAGAVTGATLIFVSYASTSTITTLGWVVLSPLFVLMGGVPGMVVGVGVGAGVGVLAFNQSQILLSANIQEQLSLPFDSNLISEQLNELSNKKLKKENPLLFALNKAKKKNIVPQDMNYDSFRLLLQSNQENIFCPNGKAQNFRKVLRNIKKLKLSSL